MSYTRNFGFRSFENIVRMARLRTPKTGNAIAIGAPVTLDPANAGYMKLAPADSKPSAVSGVLVYEHITQAGLGGNNGLDMNLVSPQDTPFATAPKGAYAQVVRGNGVKLWYKNTSTKTLYDGRTQDGVTVVASLGTLALGDSLTPAGDGTWKKADLVANPGSGWLVVESIDTTRGLVEARVAF